MPPLRTRLNRWVCASGAIGVSAALAGYLYTVNPNTSSAYPQCPLKALTGFDCPGCGGLRATHSLVHGDIAGAFDHNVFAAVFVPVMAYLILRWVLLQFDITIPAIRLPRWTAVAIPILMLVFTIVRNLTFWAPFTYLNSA